MPSTANVETLQGREASEAVGAKTTASAPTPDERAGEASGRSMTTRAMECWSCHGLSYVDYDTDTYHLYTCCYCKAVNRF